MVRRTGLGLGLRLFALLAFLIAALAQMPAGAQLLITEGAALNATLVAIKETRGMGACHYSEAERLSEEAQAHHRNSPTLLADVKQKRQDAGLTSALIALERVRDWVSPNKKGAAEEARQAEITRADSRSGLQMMPEPLMRRLSTP